MEDFRWDEERYCYVNSAGEAYKSPDVRNMYPTDIVIPTGSTEYTKTKNVYDIAGNVEEWTQEANGTNKKVSRGNHCGYYESHYSSGIETDIDVLSGGNSIGTRPILYIK